MEEGREGKNKRREVGRKGGAISRGMIRGQELSLFTELE